MTAPYPELTTAAISFLASSRENDDLGLAARQSLHTFRHGTDCLGLSPTRLQTQPRQRNDQIRAAVPTVPRASASVHFYKAEVKVLDSRNLNRRSSSQAFRNWSQI